MCEDPNHPDAGLGMIGFTLTGDSAPTLEWREQVKARNVADVVCARSANEAFAVAQLLQSTSAGKTDNLVHGETRGRADDSLIDDSDSLGRGSDSDEDEEELKINGVQLTSITLPFPAGAAPPPLIPGQRPVAMEIGDKEEEHKGGIDGTPPVPPRPLLHPGTVAPAMPSLTSSTPAAVSTIGAVMARGDKLLREAASAVAAAKTATSKTSTGRAPRAGKTEQARGNDAAMGSRQGRDMDQRGDENSAARGDTQAGERERARALAKQRGRERGKQREQELEVEKLKKAERQKEREVERREQRRLRQEQDQERALRRQDADIDNEIREDLHDEKRKTETMRSQRHSTATNAASGEGAGRGSSENCYISNDVGERRNDARASLKGTIRNSRSGAGSRTSESPNRSRSGSRRRERPATHDHRGGRGDGSSRGPRSMWSGKEDSADGGTGVAAAVDWSPWRSVDSNDSSSVDESSVRKELPAAGQVDLGRHRGTLTRRERSVSVGSGNRGQMRSGGGVESLGADTSTTSTRQRRADGREKGSDDDRVALLGDSERRRTSQAVVGVGRTGHGNVGYGLDGCRGGGGRDERARSNSTDERRRRRQSRDRGRGRSRSPFSLERDGRQGRGRVGGWSPSGTGEGSWTLSRGRAPREVQSRLNDRSRRDSSRSRERRSVRSSAWRRGSDSRSRSRSFGRDRSRSRERRFPRSRSRERRRLRSHSRSLSASLRRRERRLSESRPSGLPSRNEDTPRSGVVPPPSLSAVATGDGMGKTGGVKNRSVAPESGAASSIAAPPAPVSAAVTKQRVASDGGVKGKRTTPQSGVATMHAVLPVSVAAAATKKRIGRKDSVKKMSTAPQLGLPLSHTAAPVSVTAERVASGGSVKSKSIAPHSGVVPVSAMPTTKRGSQRADAALGDGGEGGGGVSTAVNREDLSKNFAAVGTIEEQQDDMEEGEIAPSTVRQPKKQPNQKPKPKRKHQPVPKPVPKQLPKSPPGSKQPKKTLATTTVATAATAKRTAVGQQVQRSPKQVLKSPPGSKQFKKKQATAALAAAATAKPTAVGQQVQRSPKQVPKSPLGSKQFKKTPATAALAAAATAKPAAVGQWVQPPPGKGKNFLKKKLKRERKAAAVAASMAETAKIVATTVAVAATTQHSDTPAKTNAIGGGTILGGEGRGGDGGGGGGVGVSTMPGKGNQAEKAIPTGK